MRENKHSLQTNAFT